jgi:hypothetical protein
LENPDTNQGVVHGTTTHNLPFHASISPFSVMGSGESSLNSLGFGPTTVTHSAPGTLRFHLQRAGYNFSGMSPLFEIQTNGLLAGNLTNASVTFRDYYDPNGFVPDLGPNTGTPAETLPPIPDSSTWPSTVELLAERTFGPGTFSYITTTLANQGGTANSSLFTIVELTIPGSIGGSSVIVPFFDASLMFTTRVTLVPEPASLVLTLTGLGLPLLGLAIRHRLTRGRMR